MSLKIRRKLTKEKAAKLAQYRNDIKNALNLAQTFAEYFLIIGIDPKIAMRTYLYNTEPNEILKFYSNEIKPEILSKYPPMKKSYINIDNSIIDICFPNEFKLEQFSSKPEPEIFYYLLDNYFYSINYPHKYITCFKFYENLESYNELKNQLQKKVGNNYNVKIPKYDGGGQSNVNHFLDYEEEDLNVNVTNRKKSDEIGDDIIFKKNKEKLKNLYFPKIICLISLQPFYREQELILRNIYEYYLSSEKKTIPLEKIILNLLCNIPMPPNGLFEISYKFNNEINEQNINKEIKIKRHKYNELKNIDDNLFLIFSIFDFNIDIFIDIFKYSLYEIKTLIFGSNVNYLCLIINGILSSLYPFNYSFQVSSCVPNNAFDVLESISPYILGINQKYNESFFSDNKIEINDVDLMIIDIDNKTITIKSENKENYPDLPKIYYKKIKSGIEDAIKKINKSKNKDELNLFSYIFFDFFLTILNDYSSYLNKDYFYNKSKYKNSSIKGLFKIKEFIYNHSSNERSFLNKFVNTQMFGDFIFKKMLPKNTNDKMDILFFDENINKKSNDKKLFGKKKALFFLTSKEYQYKHTFNVPKPKELSQEEKYRYENKNYKNKNLYLGQDIDSEYNSNTDEFDYIFKYILFPVLNNDYFFAPNYDYYFTALINDIDRINTDILSQSHQGSIEEDDGGMRNYIYLAYIEMWGYSYYYQNNNERDYRFNQLIGILDRASHHEIELFNLLFESLNKFQETDKIIKLYERLLYYKITPNTFIYSIIGKIIDKGKKTEKKEETETEENKNFNEIERYLSFIKKNKLNTELQKRTFRDETEINILSDIVTFKTTQLCPECGKIIDIETISLNYKNMKKDSLWAECPSCHKSILPRLTVILGNDINLGKNEENIKVTKFILHSPYELKVNLKETIDKNGCQLFDVEKFKMAYPSLFWSCIWYFRLNKIDFEIMLPYESNIFNNKNININKFNSEININSIINIDKNEENKENKENIRNNNKIKLNKIKKYKYNNIIQDVFSFYYIKNKYYKFNLGNIKDNQKKFKSDIISRRATALCFNFAKKYNSISEFLNSGQDINNDKDKSNYHEIIKKKTMKHKPSNKFIENYHIEEIESN